MFDGLLFASLPYALPAAPIMVGSALVIAAAGHYRGPKGAKVAAITIWTVAFLMQSLAWAPRWAPIRSLVIVAIVTTACIALIYLPMKWCRGREWSKGRLIWGIVGAALASTLPLPLTLILACTMGVDCI